MAQNNINYLCNLFFRYFVDKFSARNIKITDSLINMICKETPRLPILPGTENWEIVTYVRRERGYLKEKRSRMKFMFWKVTVKRQVKLKELILHLLL